MPMVKRTSQDVAAGKRQKSLLNFFTQPTSSRPAKPERIEPAEDVPAESPVQDVQDEEEEPVRKKLRLSDGDSDTVTALPKAPIVVPRSRITQRTEHWLSSSAREEEQDEAAKLTNVMIHEKFVKKLGKPGNLSDFRRRRRRELEPEEEEEEEEAEEDAEDEDGPVRKSNGSKKKTALTPMEKQMIDLKKHNPDALLVIEVGYKYQMFGEDARTAAKELGIVCIPGKYRFDEHVSEAHLNRFASASFPTHRLHVHVRRLVSAGHKVGVVRQLETAALKAVGDNRYTPFVRKLTNLYTKGTYIDDQDDLDQDTGYASDSESFSAGYILCITESNAKGWGKDDKVHVGIVAVQPKTGDIVHDNFEDDFMRSEIETRLLHIAPMEFLIVGELSKSTEKLVRDLAGSKNNVFHDRARIERLPKPQNMAVLAYSEVTKFYARELTSSPQQGKGGREATTFDKILQLPEHEMICLASLIKHLTAFNLEHVFDLGKSFQCFSVRYLMSLNGTTLSSLEIYQNQTDHTRHGTLFWALDRTKTRFGQRLLRRWVGRPLIDRPQLEARISAVEELKDSHTNPEAETMKKLLPSIKVDLEKSLMRICYGRCTRPELLHTLQTLQKISMQFLHVNKSSDALFRSSVLNDLVASLPLIHDDVVRMLDKIDPEAAKSNDKYNFFRKGDATDGITTHQAEITATEQDLDDYRSEAAAKLGQKNVDFVTVAGVDYLIEVDNANLKGVPASWIKESGTKKVSRFRSPETIILVRKRDQHRELLAAACDAAYQDLLTSITDRSQAFRNCIQSLATLDCLFSLAEVAAQPGYTKPVYTDDICLEITGGRHPMVEQMLLDRGDTFVPNNINLHGTATRALLVTGPNMGGKSSYVRQVALIAIMGQIGSYVPADSAKLGMLDAVFTRMGAFDNMMAGESTFMVELSETADVLKKATPRSLVILDELGRGTSTHDGVAIASAVLDYIVRQTKCLTLFITHYQNLSSMAKSFKNEELRNVHMRFEEMGEGGQDIRFLYEVGHGVAHRSYG